MVSLIVVVLDNTDYLKVFTESVKRNTAIPYEILIWDNGSKVNVQDYYANEAYVTFYRSEINVGIGKAANELVNTAKYKNVILFDPDMYVLPSWTNAVKVVENQGGWRALVEIGVRKPDRQVYGNYGDLWSFKEEELLKDFEGRVVKDVIIAPYFPAVVRKEDWIESGGYNEQFLVAESYIYYRLAKLYDKRNIRMLLQPDAFHYHFNIPSGRVPNYSELQDKWWNQFFIDTGLTEDSYRSFMKRNEYVGPSMDELGMRINYNT